MKDHAQQTGQELKEILVYVNRVTKVVKGGRRFGFNAIVIVGDGKGRVGYGLGKAKEVVKARAKATDAAKKNMIKVNLREGRTIHHDVQGKFGSAWVILRSAPPGTGVIAGGAMRAIFEALGLRDIVAKSKASSAHNVVKATFDAFQNLSTPKLLAERRNLKIGEIIERRESNTTQTQEQ